MGPPMPSVLPPLLSSTVSTDIVPVLIILVEVVTQTPPAPRPLPPISSKVPALLDRSDKAETRPPSVKIFAPEPSSSSELPDAIEVTSPLPKTSSASPLPWKCPMSVVGADPLTFTVVWFAVPFVLYSPIQVISGELTKFWYNSVILTVVGASSAELPIMIVPSFVAAPSTVKLLPPSPLAVSISNTPVLFKFPAIVTEASPAPRALLLSISKVPSFEVRPLSAELVVSLPIEARALAPSSVRFPSKVVIALGSSRSASPSRLIVPVNIPEKLLTASVACAAVPLAAPCSVIVPVFCNSPTVATAEEVRPGAPTLNTPPLSSVPSTVRLAPPLRLSWPRLFQSPRTRTCTCPCPAPVRTKVAPESCSNPPQYGSVTAPASVRVPLCITTSSPGPGGTPKLQSALLSRSPSPFQSSSAMAPSL